jgi:hypothetical protein
VANFAKTRTNFSPFSSTFGLHTTTTCHRATDPTNRHHRRRPCAQSPPPPPPARPVGLLPSFPPLRASVGAWGGAWSFLFFFLFVLPLIRNKSPFYFSHLNPIISRFVYVNAPGSFSRFHRNFNPVLKTFFRRIFVSNTTWNGVPLVVSLKHARRARRSIFVPFCRLHRPGLHFPTRHAKISISHQIFGSVFSPRQQARPAST